MKMSVLLKTVHLLIAKESTVVLMHPIPSGRRQTDKQEKKKANEKTSKAIEGERKQMATPKTTLRSCWNT